MTPSAASEMPPPPPISGLDSAERRTVTRSLSRSTAKTSLSRTVKRLPHSYFSTPARALSPPGFRPHRTKLRRSVAPRYPSTSSFIADLRVSGAVGSADDSTGPVVLAAVLLPLSGSACCTCSNR
eukprot:294230-Rhodomonas_salina.1